jgi:hypothetical protein
LQKRVLSEVAKRCKGLDEELRKHQSPAVKRAAGKINVGLLTMIVILIGWADWMLPMRFHIGFQAVGLLEDSHLWSLVDEGQPEGMDEILHERDALLRECARDRRRNGRGEPRCRGQTSQQRNHGQLVWAGEMDAYTLLLPYPVNWEEGGH